MLSYQQYCDYFANQCKVCNGNKIVLIDGISRGCACQYIASIKWKFDQIPVDPPTLKSLTWSDFTGITVNNESFTGCLEESSFVQSKELAMKYCFGDACYNGPLDRHKNLIIQNKIGLGENLIISGDSHSGKSLIALLIIKEVIYASLIHKLSAKFKWIKAIDLAYAARWDNDSGIDHDFLDEISEVEFLVIDGLDMSFERGHTTPPDAIMLDRVFESRQVAGYPTIFICSSAFNFLDKMISSRISRFWGSSILKSMSLSKNTIINLRKKDTKEDVQGKLS